MTERDARGKFLAPDASVRIAAIPQVDRETRYIYAHTRAHARALRHWLCENPANVDGLSQGDIALITQG